MIPQAFVQPGLYFWFNSSKGLLLQLLAVQAIVAFAGGIKSYLSTSDEQLT